MRRSHEVQRAAIADLGVVTWTARPGDADWRVTTISRGIEHMLGYSRDEWRTEGFWIEKIHEQDRDRVASHLERAWRAHARNAEICEYRILDAAGQVHWLRTSARRSAPRSRTLLGAHVDITDEFQTLEAARLSAERLSFVAAAANLRWWDEPVTAQERATSAALASLAGLDPRRRTTPTEWLTRVHPHDRDRYMQKVEHWTRDDAEAAPPPRALEAFSYRVRHVDGSIRWITTTMARAHETGGLGARVLGAASDMTAKVSMLKDLRAAEQLYQDVWNSMSAMAVVLDRNGTIVEVNRAWLESARAQGRDDGYVGTSYLDLAHRAATPTDASTIAAANGLASVLHGRAPQFSLDYRSERPGEGNDRWFRMRVIALRRPARGAVVMHDDITDSVAAEWSTKQHRDDLAHLQRLATLGELATSIAHELNQPLTAIMAAASTARRLLRDAPDDDLLNGIVADILESVVRAAEVVRRARAMVRRDDPVLEPLAINNVVSDVARLIGSDLVIRQVALTLDLDATVASVRGDRVQLQQVFLNLLLNAIDAVSDLPGAARNIIVTTRAHGVGQIAVVIRDTGPGIPPALGDRVFEPFVTTKRQGTGLGLAIVRAIVQAHNGQIRMETPEEGGAAFRVVLPAC